MEKSCAGAEKQDHFSVFAGFFAQLFLGKAVLDLCQGLIHAKEKDQDFAINTRYDRAENQRKQPAEECSGAASVAAKTGAHDDQAPKHGNHGTYPE